MEKIAFIIKHFCAVVLILSSIVMAAYQVYDIDSVSNGLLMYVAQAFLLAGSIFGLDYYVKKLNKLLNETKRNSPEQPS